MNILIPILIFILGSLVGSFLSVAIYRIHKKKKGIILSRSICTSCKQPLKWNYLIPIFSWIFLRGKCGYCGKKISVHYLALEVLTGLTFLVTYLKWNFLTATTAANLSPISYQINWQIFTPFIFNLVIFSFLLAIFFYDLFYKEIPDRFSLPALAIAIAAGVVLQTPTPLEMLYGGLIIGGFFALQFFGSKGTWIGGGDIRLGALMGVLLGWKLGLVALFISYVLGGLISLLLLTNQKISRKTQIPFAPFLIIGTFTAVFYGQEILNWYLGGMAF